MSRTSPRTVDVSVVIPTAGRSSLQQAVASARAQRGVEVEIVVVVDHLEGSMDLGPVVAASDTVLWTGGGRGAGYARNLGVRHARGRWIAHLDDDDLWRSDKLQVQLAAGEPIRRSGRPVLLSSRVLLRSHTSTQGFPVPATTYSGGPVADYLFAGRGVAADRPALFSSTLLVDRPSALACPWDDALSRHQDWDWVLRFSEVPGAVIRQVPEVLGEQFVGSAGSVSASHDWLTSLLWGRRFKGCWSGPAYTDFMTGQVLRFALAARSARGVHLALRELAGSARPSRGTVALGLSGLVPRRLLTWLAFVVRAAPRADVGAPVQEPDPRQPRSLAC